MIDTLSKTDRSALMSRVRGVNTSPEIAVRRFLHEHGFRFRIHPCNLPGRPDIVLPKLNTVIFVHGCFWHRHAGCTKTTTPSTRQAFWNAKFKANVERDKRKAAELTEQGWKIITIWECEVTPERLRHLVLRLKRMKNSTKAAVVR
jgi:DNA mismatch endonuclease (patch repair protein)